MSRVINKPSEAVPNTFYEVETYGGMSVQGELVAVKAMTLAECAQIARTYGSLCRLAAKVLVIVRDGEKGSKSRRRYYRLFLRIIRARDAWESLFNSPEWGGK